MSFHCRYRQNKEPTNSVPAAACSLEGQALSHLLGFKRGVGGPAVKCRASTSGLQRELVRLSAHEACGNCGLVVKCPDITKNPGAKAACPGRD